MGRKAGEKWTAEAVSQPTFPKSDRLLGESRCACTGPRYGLILRLHAARQAAKRRGWCWRWPLVPRAAAHLALGARSGIDDRQVAGNVLTMLLAGEDTTANTIAWMVRPAAPLGH